MILDVGCGRRKRGNIGIDYCRSNYGKKIFLDIQGISENLPFRDNIFEKVVSWNVFEHCLNPYNFLKECLRVTKPTGLIEIVTDNPYHYAWTVLKCGVGGMEHTDFATDHYGIYYPENLRRMFKLLSIKEVNFEWMVKRPWLITYPFANFLVKIGIWRKECLFWTYKITGMKN